MADVVGASADAEDAVVNAFLAYIFMFMAVISCGFVVASVLRLRSEEAAGRAEAVLATPVSRTTWMAATATVALVAVATLTMLMGLGLALGYAPAEAQVCERDQSSHVVAGGGPMSPVGGSFVPDAAEPAVAECAVEVRPVGTATWNAFVNVLMGGWSARLAHRAAAVGSPCWSPDLLLAEP